MSDETREEIVSELRAYKAANLDWLTNLEKAKVVASYNNLLASMPPAQSAVASTPPAQGQMAVFAPYQSSEYDGIQDMSYALPRSHLVADLFQKVTDVSNHFIHLGSPAASGKTSLLQLFQRYCSERKVTCIYVSMLLEDFKGELRDKTGINSDRWMLEPDQNGRCVCADDKTYFVVMLDDAQHRYGDVNLWSSLIKSDFEHKLPDNIKFVISATYSLGTDVSPIDFRTLPKLVLGDFRLKQEEVDEFITLSSVRMGAERAGLLLKDPVIHNLIAANCNGHIGAMSVSVREIVKHFFHNTTVTVEEIVSFYLSKKMCSNFLRCYSSGVNSLTGSMQAYLVNCLTMGPISMLPDENSAAYGQLIRSGVLEVTEDDQTKFTSPAAASYINDLIFPRRSGLTVNDVRKRGVFELMKSVLARMSGTTLKQSVVNSFTDMPSEATFQHLMLAALEAETPPTCFICPELSKFFPPPFSKELGVEIEGRCDFYINGELRWAIEALINGNGVGEHLARLEGQGKYVQLNYQDYLVVDFRVNATGEPTNVQKHRRRLSVFFKQGDFSYCNVLCGLEDAERITLAN
eukprot:CAMPEP_0201094074 /NCGR_PEP_ID=MMETSP0812-20130820/2494_1 /ASSEMBLY_ACC=CAM_ASM_000668 /TAXON_ID=98059 /ORGANISM="Dinobryon sp., Strain UTEXLB2267" /LENGTH=575 /DNA_ID=CAMNT_0047346531 /DNA_START=21 /DNA_END=1748 /DNA_ORIENTATION=+